MNWANEKAQRQSSAGAQLVLITLADYADKDGLCWPSIETLAERSVQSARTVLRQLAGMERTGVLKRQTRTKPDGTRSTSAYYLQFDRVAMAPSDKLSSGEPSDKLSHGQPCDTNSEKCPESHAQRGEVQNRENFDHVTKTAPPCDTARILEEPPIEPSKKERTSLVPIRKLRKVAFEPQDRKLASWMLTKIREVHSAFREPNLDAWADEIRLMRERDGRTHREMAELFRWANADAFWRTNILSPHKLRAQWDTLAIKREAARQTASVPMRSRATEPPAPREHVRCDFVDEHGQRCECEGQARVNGVGHFCAAHLWAAHR